ncbi:MAG: Transcriptional regulator, TraR/DksA family [uncultured Sulfurovum sp.]|uniref:Transcriptional regulator, TraR/DksA family n=1 Tax=uncultured Sulfurovum sp. TaxID=269237 RepID=A0A6S6U8B0_9BACT|nr:MAG: Transcriptional regulator, TraR/DksA family [uncultured Sulfurovum sp.]
MTRAIKNNYYNTLGQEELSEEELAFFQEALKIKKTKIEENLKNANQESSTQTQNRCQDEGDYASLEVINNINSLILKEQTITLNKINRSLNKIIIGTYGICSTCEEPINIERLKIKMFTEYCVPCREMMEKEK